MSDMSVIEALEAENDLLSPAARKGGSANPIAAVGLLGAGAVMMYLFVGTGPQNAGAMTDPDDESWRVATVTIGSPQSELKKASKVSNRLVLPDPIPKDAQGIESPVVADEPELESFDVPAPETDLDALASLPMPDDDAAVPIAPPTEDRSAPRIIDENVTFAPMPTDAMAAVALLPADGADDEQGDDVTFSSQGQGGPFEAIIERDYGDLPASMRDDPPPTAPAEAGTDSTGFVSADEEVAATDTDEEKWRRYRSQMVLFDASSGATRSEVPSNDPVVEGDAFQPVGRAGGAYGYFPGGRD